MEYAISGLIVMVGFINFIPVIGVASRAKLESLYGVRVDEPNLAILLRHRAMLFGLTGGFLMVAAFVQHLRPSAYVLGFMSMISFLMFYKSEGVANSQVRKVAKVDLVGIVLLSAAAVAEYFQ